MSGDKTYPELAEVKSNVNDKEVIELKSQVSFLKELLSKNGIDVSIPIVSDVEYICISEIQKLKILSDKGGLTLEDCKALEILHKNLLQARGKISADTGKSKKEQKHNIAELFNIVKGGKSE